MNDIASPLARLRSRITGQLFLDRLAACALLFAGGLLAVAAINVLRGAAPLNTALCVAFPACAFLAAAMWTWSGMPSMERTAALIDRQAGTSDRFLTAYDFSRSPSRTAFQEAAIGECAQYISKFDVEAHTRFRSPERLRWLVVPLAALALLAWQQKATHRTVMDTAAGAETNEQAAALEKIAREIEKSKSEDLKKIAEEIRNSEKRMKAAKPGEAEKTALKEMSSLEGMMQEMMNARKKATPGELAAVSAGLKQSEATKEAAAALQEGKAEEAAKKLEQALHEQQQQQQKAQLNRAAEAVQQALAQLSENQKGALSRAMENKQSENRQGQDGEKNGAQSLQRLAQALRQSGNSQGNQQQGSQQTGQQTAGDNGKQQGNSSSQESLKNALASLQSLKYGTPQDSGGGKQGQEGDSSSKVLVQSSGQPNQPGGQPMALPGTQPSGMPGSEHDLGTTKDPYGAQLKKTGGATKQAQATGVAGQGESLHDFMTSTGDTSKATQNYRELYNAMLPAAEDALEQENIPLGSRFYIKRYFQNIRPKE